MEHVVQRQLGAFRLTLISEATWLYPAAPVFVGGSPDELRREVGADERGLNPAAGNLLLVQTPAATVLVDAGDAEPPLGPPAEGAHWRAPLAIALGSLGLAPADVTHVAITHPHGDHVAGATALRDGRELPRFPAARYVLSRLDWAGVDQSRPAARHLVALREAGVLDLVDLPHRLTPGVELLWTPGHTPGHAVVRIESSGQVAYFLGDLFHHCAEFRRLEWGGRTPEQRAQIAASRRAIIAAALREGALLALSHSFELEWYRLAPASAGAGEPAAEVSWEPA